ncbi:hypothetical protein RFI_06796, partial [Reticulomyxa filosa]
MQRRSFGFEVLPNLPIPISSAQCIAFQDEILICGGMSERRCYSYHIVKQNYKLICSYPDRVGLLGHAVIKYKSNDKEVTLLSFGGSVKHTLQMHYRSVWEVHKEHKNQWTPTQQLGYFSEDLWYCRGLISGNDNQLIFLLFPPRTIAAYDIKSFDLVARLMLPIENISGGSCFVKVQDKMLLVNAGNRLSITFDESTQKFDHIRLPLCLELKDMQDYSYVAVKSLLILFGGYDLPARRCMKTVYTYSVKERRWIECFCTLPFAVRHSFALVHQGWIHIIGGAREHDDDLDQHLRIRVDDLVGK